MASKALEDPAELTEPRALADAAPRSREEWDEYNRFNAELYAENVFADAAPRSREEWDEYHRFNAELYEKNMNRGRPVVSIPLLPHARPRAPRAGSARACRTRGSRRASIPARSVDEPDPPPPPPPRICEACGGKLEVSSKRRYCDVSCGARHRKRLQRERERNAEDVGAQAREALSRWCWQAARQARSERDKWKAFEGLLIALVKGPGFYLPLVAEFGLEVPEETES